MAEARSMDRRVRGSRGTKARAAVSLALALLGAASGCKRDEKPTATQTTGAPVALPAASAPFPTPPVLPGTPDVPALVARCGLRL